MICLPTKYACFRFINDNRTKQCFQFSKLEMATLTDNKLGIVQQIISVYLQCILKLTGGNMIILGFQATVLFLQYDHLEWNNSQTHQTHGGDIINILLTMVSSECKLCILIFSPMIYSQHASRLVHNLQYSPWTQLVRVHALVVGFN